MKNDCTISKLPWGRSYDGAWLELILKANQDWVLMPYNLANIKPSDIYSLHTDTDRTLSQSHPETDLLVALHCSGSGNLVTFTEWICSKTKRPFMSACVCWGRGGGGVLIRWGTFIIFLLYLAGFFKTLSPNGPFAPNSIFFYRPKAISKLAIIKAKSATIAFFSSPPFLLLALAFSPFFTVCYYDFGASRS